MALPATLLHFDLHLAHADSGLDRDLSFKIARHPSENMERVWLRVLAYVWKWREGISLGRSYRDAPEIDGLVIIEGRLPIGEIVPVVINGALAYDLTGVAKVSKTIPAAAVG